MTRSCGARRELSATLVRSLRGPFEPPEPGAARIGWVISVNGRMLRRNGVALREAGEVVLVLVKGEESVEMPTGSGLRGPERGPRA